MAAPARHYGMDWLRIGAFALLILYHIGMFFVPWGWHVKTPQPVAWAQIPMFATNAWRLALLFAVSGYASAALFAKLGSRGEFLRSRTVRLLVPLVFGMAVIVPLQPWVELQFKHGYTASFAHFWTNDYFRFGALDGIVLPTWNHLWFVVYLWVYTFALGIALLILPARLRAALARIAERALAGPLLLLVPFALMALRVFVLFPGGEETHDLVADAFGHSAYLPIFLFGWLLFSSETLWAGIRRWWLAAGLLAIAAYIGFCLLLAVPGSDGASGALPHLMGALRIVQGWGAIVGLIGLADRFWNRDLPIRPMLTEAVFPFYIVHQTIIVGVGWWLLSAWPGNGPAFLVLLAATVGGCTLFYVIGRRIAPLRPLIGLSWRDRLKPKAG